MCNLHLVWRAGFDTCHGSDICDGNNWANVQTDAEASRVYEATLLALTILLLLGNTALVLKKHIAGLSVSWKVVAVMSLLWLPVPISNAAVSMPAQALRFTANEVACLPSPIFMHSRSLFASTSPVSPPNSFTRWPRKTRFAATTWWR